jgi:hypothetical protein
MERRDKPVDVDPTDGTEDPPLGSRIAEAALERWEVLDRLQSKRRRPRERQN